MIKIYNCKDIYKYYKKNGGILAYDIFKKIVAENNKMVSALVINIGYHYQIPYEGSILKIISNKRHIKIKEVNGTIIGAVNWGESNKLKQSILDRNGILYECQKNELGEIVSDNGGEKWIVYFTDDKYYQWVRIGREDVHNSSNYSFSPTWTNARALIASITENSDITYKEPNRNGTSRRNFFEKLAATSRLNVRAEQ